MGSTSIFTIILIIAASVFSTLAADFIIPEDGNFLVDFSSGSPRVEMLSIHNPNETVQPMLSPEARKRPKLQVDKKKCYSDRRLNLKDYTRSLQMLDDLCAKSPLVPESSIWGYKVGSAYAYMCSYGGYAEHRECSPEELHYDLDYIDQECGSIVEAGWVHHRQIKKRYGRDLSTSKICKGVNL
ncbi:hypothetical protein Hte_004359 [Hypoxylon texense]